ncbi:MAG: hypothetical protein HY683_07315 [Chloroflexi bacterium]|nr:hypothetical protein [Chloroflexota bacterium]
MVLARVRCLANHEGRKRAVVLRIEEYRRLEGLEDALDLDKAQRTATEFRDYQQVRADAL